MSKIEIEIPNNKEIDWEASAEQKQIVFKDKQLTYENVCNQLFTSEYWYSDSFGRIAHTTHANMDKYDSNNASTKHQLECILAKNMLANVARYLNGNWDSFFTDRHYIIWMYHATRSLHIKQVNLSSEYSTVIFKSRELAQQAIEILGEETVKLALEPLY
jgi:hypothetical protein